MTPNSGPQGPTPNNTPAAMAQIAAAGQLSYVYSQFAAIPYITDQLDIQDEPLYDRTIFAAATGQINDTSSQWFSSVVGPGTNKTIVDTNMRQNSVLPFPEAFAILGIRLAPQDNVLTADWLAILNNFVFNLMLNTKSYNRGDIRHYAAGMGSYVGTTLGGTQFLANGFPSVGAGHLLALPLVITNGLSFSAQLNTGNLGPYTLNANGTGLTFRCNFVGLHARAVQ
jgi:hypothetical protein